LPNGNNVHLWNARLDRLPVEVAELETLLSEDELQRANRFHFRIHRSRFIAGRGILRLTLARYLRQNPRELAFIYSEFGKPSLLNSSGCRLEFNAAHCEDRLIVAVALRPVGIDLEILRAIPELESMAEQVFSAEELTAWGQRAASDKLCLFLKLWTRKEALLKGIGFGIARHVKEVSTFFETGDVLRIPKALTQDTWSVHTEVGSSFIQSVATPGQTPEVTALAADTWV